MSDFLRRYEDRLVLLAILISSLIVWWPSRNLPYFWDSSGFVIPAAEKLLETHFVPWIAQFSDFAHPPLLMSLLAIGWKIAGQNIQISHMLMWGFYPLLLWSTYLIAQKMRILVPVFAVVLVGMLPYVLAEYMNIYVDLPVGALATAALAAGMHKRLWWVAGLLSLAVLTKETAILVVPGIAILWWPWADMIQKKQILNKTLARELGYLLMPVGIWVLYLSYHQHVTGWYLIQPGRQIRELSTDMIGTSIAFVLEKLLFDQNRMILTLLGLTSTGYLAYRKAWGSFIHPELGAMIATVLLGVIFFGWTGEFALRYAIFISPLFILAILYVISQAIELLPTTSKTWVFAGVLCIPLIYMGQALYPKAENLSMEMQFSPPDDLRVLDMIGLGQEASHFLEANYNQAQIFGGFPENIALTQPLQGYASTPLTFAECGKIDEFFQEDTVNLVYFHLYSPIQAQCAQQLLARKHQLIHRFERNGKWIGIYQIENILPEPQKEIMF